MRDILIGIAVLLDDIKTAVETIATNTTPADDPSDDEPPADDNVGT